MNKIIFAAGITFIAAATFSDCSSEPENKTGTKGTDSLKTAVSPFLDSAMQLKSGNAFFTFTLQPISPACHIPAIQSFASATLGNYVIIVAGQKYGFHGTSNNPPPFQAKVANDSMWVIDIVNWQSWGCPVPSGYEQWLEASNPASCQVNDYLYIAGGYTRSSQSAPRYDMTSDHLLGINLPNLISYIQNGGTTPSISSVITINIQSPFVQVTGGEMIFNYPSNYFYLIGGQNYNAVYSSGTNGIYTNAIRRFTLNSSATGLTDTSSYIDPVNLHRRDLNVVPVAVNGQLSATIYGGVFTKNDMAYRNPVYVSGWQGGQLSITPDTMQTNFNQYSCAFMPMWINDMYPTYTAFFGGISYEIYDPVSQHVVVGDHGMPMPFSNIISVIGTDGMTISVEAPQLPPDQPLMPAYLGANAQFFPMPQYVSKYPGIVDLNKVFPSAPTTVTVGYMFGGIRSMGPTSGTTPQGHVETYPNPVMYAVVIGPAVNMMSKGK